MSTAERSPASGIPHRRDDGELLGWIHEEGEDWIAVDVLGRVASDAVDWLAAEEVLERIGLAWLADPWILEEQDTGPVRVRIVEVTPDHADGPGRIVVKIEDFGAVGPDPIRPIVLPWPLPAGLRPPRPGDPDGFTLTR